MFRPRVIPCLLLKGKGLVKTIQFKNPTYVGDPINAVRIFNKCEADELVFLDITASLENRCVSDKVVSQIAHEAYMPFGVGGGITNISQMRALVSCGAEKIILNTAAVLDNNLITKGAKLFGSSSVVVSIDVKKNLFGRYETYIAGGTKNTKFNPVEIAKTAQQAGAGEILLTSINRDGTMKGYDIELIKEVSMAVSIPVIACGGAGKLPDFREAVIKGHASAVEAGSLFVFHGPRRAVLINYPTNKELVKIFRN